MGYVLGIRRKCYSTPDVEFKFNENEFGSLCEMMKAIVVRMDCDMAVQVTREEIECCDLVGEEVEE